MNKRKPGVLKRSVGRPTAYDPATHPERAMNYALLGMSDIEIAAAFNIDQATLYRWQNRHPEFRESIKAGKVEADARVVKRLYERACGMMVPVVKVLARQDREAEIVQYEDYLPPDVNAARLWLFNRQPGRWRDKREIEVTGSLEHRIALMSSEERLEELSRLQAKVDLLMTNVIERESVEVDSED